MATIDDVLIWAKSLPAWQADTIRRLLLAGEHPLSAKDYSEVLLLAKADLKLVVPPDDLKPVPIPAGQFSNTATTPVAIKLLAIDDVRNVNILQSGQTQSFAESGITVVYGDNGSGKSGFSRILKLSCQARDKSEFILPNVFASAPGGAPTATLKIKQDAISTDIKWTQGAVADPILMNIAVFDGRCARAITDDRNEVTYLPYGAEVFQKTAEIVLKVKSDIESEIVDLAVIHDSAIQVGTPSALFLETLSENSKDDVIQTATAWTLEDETELTKQEKLSRESESLKATEEVGRLNRLKGRIDDIVRNLAIIVAASSGLSDDAVEQVLTELKAAQLAHATAVAERKMAEPLSGVASTSQWEILYKAAKQYSEQVAYPGEPFPKTKEAVCVLCQQPLSDDAIARFGRFKKFMEDATNTVLASKREALRLLREKFERLAPLSGTPLESICDELTNLDSTVADAFQKYHLAVAARKASALKLLDEGNFSDTAVLLPAFAASCDSALRVVSDALTVKATEIMSAAKPEEYKKLLADVDRLKSRKALSLRKSEIDTFVTRARRNADLRRAAATLRTNEITRQGTMVIRKNLTPELLNAFKDELLALGATRVPILVKPCGATGETAHEMMLEGATLLGRAHLSNVLSEGEARVTAIAGFLAELRLAPHANAIVLDDPVSSLDHVFTGKIAQRLAREGLKRQVIVFTHNIAFLMELEDARDALGKSGTPVAVTVHTLRRGAKSAGITRDGAPWSAMKVNTRAQILDELVHKAKSDYQEDMTVYNAKAARIYGLLREAWESCVENDLFYSVVCRYRTGVQTLKLDEVAIEDTDSLQIDLHMSKASTWMEGHDKSMALHVDRPSPDELLVDINALKTFSKKIVDRRKATKKRHEDLLKPS